ncbi:MAG: hypothetical protein CEN89_293 [Candidatus Berkelbacteria bacterium Licking1014_7]|uniref:Uncharacterized protein n=1 Tax=Candidatus Berkelbacteria bacterium Licking1014_7 TaxID=2017147 RepID=A0A554LJK3_9BACT|nr:MAG: hypothetical protein CEN89_293 [Candidatus Berkelbacteria bacterium Licking1014_7]
MLRKAPRSYGMKVLLAIPPIIYGFAHRIGALVILFEMLSSTRFKPNQDSYIAWRFDQFVAEIPPRTFWKFMRFLYSHKTQIWSSAMGGSSRRWGLTGH